MGQVVIQQTPVPMREYALALMRAWRTLYDDVPIKAAAGVLWAQYMIETGGKACWNFNIGNVKVSQSQIDAGVDWIDLPGTWEILGGQHVVLAPGHPGRRFRAFGSLEEAMTEHLRFLRGKYAPAWPALLMGDPVSFAHLLKAGRDGKQGTADDYYTAPANSYANGMSAHHRMWMASQAWEQLLATEAPTLRELPAAEPHEDMTVQEIASLAQGTMAARRAMLEEAVYGFAEVRRSSEELALDLEKLGEGD